MNNQITPVDSTILINKLAALVVRLQQDADPNGSNGVFLTLESVLQESIKILSKFYKDLSAPGFVPNRAIPDTAPLATSFNEDMQGIADDLSVVFREFENLEGVVLGNFNYMVSRLNRLNRKLKSVSSQLGDFVLFSDLPTKDALFFGDSFNNLSRVEINSPLLNADQCEVNQVEGIVTLPIDRAAQVPITITETPVINSNSNGVVGNNQQAGASLHGTISDILDNNPDTWFEYERVVSSDDGESLVLDFTVNLGSTKVVNFVRLNPNNFGTRTQLQILAIDTSVDGKDFVSIKDDIPIADFVVEDEENVFTLAPSTSKFAGQGLYTFTPREAKYVHITLRQQTPYIIQNDSGTNLFRYAIGIRDVDIQALPYKSKGEVISTNYTVSDNIRKVVLLSNQRPDPATASNLAAINHFVSPDNGVTWHQLRPKVSSGQANVEQEIPELIDFNGVSDNSIATSNPVRTLRYRAVMSRNTDAFTSETAELAQEITGNTELHVPPTTSPFEIQLNQTPIDGSLKLIDPQLGSRGKEEVKYQIGKGNGGKKIVLLPFKPLKRDKQKVFESGRWTLRDKDPQTVYVDGETWSRSLTTTSSGIDKHYKLNFEEGRLEFGDGENGVAVRLGGVIAMTLEEEQIYPGGGEQHIALLQYPTSNDKKEVEISIVHPDTLQTKVLDKGLKRHQLEPYIISGTVSITPSPGSEVTFVDGSSELTGAGFDYSIDYTNGVLYLRTATDSSTDTTAVYQNNPRTILPESAWDFIDQGGIGNAVSIRDDYYRTFSAATESVEQAVKYFNTEHLGVVRGSLVFGDSAGQVFNEEVSFIDGRTELLGVIHTSEEIGTLSPPVGGGVVTYSFKLPITTATGFAVNFSNTDTFATAVGSTPSSPGEYRVVASSNYVEVYRSALDLDAGTVDYYYKNTQANLSGKYSVNYNNGEVFTAGNTPSIGSEPFGLAFMSYEYTNYRIKYNIARLVSEDDWTYDAPSNKITIKDREILRNIRTPQTLGDNNLSASKFYRVSYNQIKSTRANVSSLEPFFSPVLKDYALKIITRGRLV